MRTSCLFALVLILLSLAGAQASADDEGKPFAEARIVLQMADGDADSSLLTNEVRFVGCMNTVESIERATGERPDLIPETIPVQTGVARLVERAQQGFVVIRP
jgi:intracellular sulfur oxidation DsrE/DsrF family protein